jgi:prepilin-type N-terminal cleavage/methylation domain-containing protein
MKTQGRQAGFTLIELLVAVALTVLLVTSLVSIFNAGVQTVKISEARMRIQVSARAAMDHLERDLSSMLPMDGGSQRFWMRDGAIDPESPIRGNPASLSPVWMGSAAPDRHVTGAVDSMGFRTVTSVNGSLVPVQVLYRPVLDRDPARWKTAPRVVQGEIRPGRLVYILRKEILDLNGAPVRDATTGRPVAPIDLCYYVTAFNLEYMCAMSDDATNALSRLNAQFCQIAPDKHNTPDGPFPGPRTSMLNPTLLGAIPAAARAVNPMGEPDGAGEGSSPIKNDIQATTGTGTRFYPAFIVPAVRATLRVVEEIEARQERVYTRVIWLPTG